MSAAEARQRALARMIADPAFERRVREDPDAAAHEINAPAEFLRALAAIEPARVEAFRKSSAHKDSLRAGKAPAKLGW